MQTNSMSIKTKNICIAFSAILLLSCMPKWSNFKIPYAKDASISEVAEIEVVKTPIVVKPSLDENRPVDIAPLVSNYLAARVSENEGRVADAAFFYDRAEAADPQNKELKAHAFMWQLALGNMEESIRLANELVEKEDIAPIAFILLTADSLLSDDLENAKRYLKSAKAISPELLQFHILEAYIDLEQGISIETVLSKIAKLPKVKGLGAIRHYHMGRLLEKSNKLNEAQVEYEKALKIDDRSSFVILALERVYEKNKQPEKALEMFSNFLEKNPDNIMLLKSAKRSIAKLPYIEKEISITEDTAGVVFEIATLMSSQKLNVAAGQVINIAEMLDPKNSFVSFYKGVMQEQVGDYVGAIKTYNTILEGTYAWVGGQVRIADIYSKQKHFKKAISFTEALVKKHNDVIIQRILAELYYNTGDYVKAIKYYDSLLALNNAKAKGKEFWIYFARGTAYERLNMFKKAESDLREAISIAPNHAMALNYLGYMWVEHDKNLDEAFVLIGRALQIKPRDAAILDSMGWVLYKKGNFDESLLFLKRAVEYSPEDATIHMHIGDVYEKLGVLNKARTHWKLALSLKPETPKDLLRLKTKVNAVSSKLK